MYAHEIVVLQHYNSGLVLGSVDKALCMSTTCNFTFSKSDELGTEWKPACAAHVAGMEYLHSKNVAHRDFKSLNVLISVMSNNQPVAKITDFGISKDSSAGNTLANTQTLSGGPIGTPAWSAPEVIKQSGPVDPYAADVWSFGIVVWEVATRKVPWDGCSLMMTMNEVGNLARTPTMPDDAPKEMAALFKSCCVKEPTER